MRLRSASVFLFALLVTVVFMSNASAQGSVPISGTVGEIVDPDATFGGFFLRYVGDPAPAGYSHDYQWGNPYIETLSPEDEPVVFAGPLDLTDRVFGRVAMIGLLDIEDLQAGNTSFQRGAYIYVFNQNNGNVRIGVTDGNAGGEIVQHFVTIPAADLMTNPVLNITFTVDGTADPSTCADAGDSASADGCMTLEIEGYSPITDSYGTITGTASNLVEFGSGAHPGWEAFPSGDTGVDYDFLVSPANADPQNMDQCKNGGYEDYGFRNQGQCIRFVNTGQDSR